MAVGGVFPGTTRRSPTDAAIHAESDALVGLKENVILGKLIPAGTGLERYRNIKVEATPEAKAQAYSMVGYDSFDYDFGQGSGAAVPLEEFDLGDYRYIAHANGRAPFRGPPICVHADTPSSASVSDRCSLQIGEDALDRLLSGLSTAVEPVADLRRLAT